VRNLRERDQLEDLGVEEINIRKDLKRRGWESVGCCEHGNEHSGPIKCKEFVDWLTDCQLSETDCDILAPLPIS